MYKKGHQLLQASLCTHPDTLLSFHTAEGGKTSSSSSSSSWIGVDGKMDEFCDDAHDEIQLLHEVSPGERCMIVLFFKI